MSAGNRSTQDRPESGLGETHDASPEALDGSSSEAKTALSEPNAEWEWQDRYKPTSEAA